MGLLDSIKDNTSASDLFLPGSTFAMNNFGGKNEVKPASTLTAEQQAQLAALTAQNIANYPQMYSTLSSLAYTPKSTYSKLGNWESEFNTGVVNPAMNSMNTMIADTKHSSNLHSSANRLAQDKIRQNTNDKLAGLRYDQLMKERAMQMQSLENMKQNQLSALGALSNLSSQALGVNGVENIVTQNKGLLDYLAASIPGLAALA